MDALTGRNAASDRACDHCQPEPRGHSNGSDADRLSGPALLAGHDATVVSKGMIFAQNAPFTTCFVVKSGTVKTFHVNERGDEKVLGFYLPGQMFGFDGIASGVRGCSAIALERSRLGRLSLLPEEGFGRVAPELAYGILKAMSGELDSAERMNRWLSQNTAEERVIGFLLDVARRYRQCRLRETQFRLAMARGDIANYLGLALATVSRILARLRRDHLIDVHGRHVQLLQLDQLRARVCADDCEAAGTAGVSGSISRDL